MAKPFLSAFVAFLSFVLLLPALAGEEAALVTLEGKIMCASCSTKKEERKHCQKMLIVEAGDEAKYYYVEMNEVEHRFGSDCKKVTRVRVTGTVAEKGEQMWITAKKITRLKAVGA